MLNCQRDNPDMFFCEMAAGCIFVAQNNANANRTEQKSRV